MAESTTADSLPRSGRRGVVKDSRGVADPGRRRLLGLTLGGSVAALFGRGAYDTGMEVKRAIEGGVRFFKSLDDFLYKKDGAIQISDDQSAVKIEPVQDLRSNEFTRLFHDLEPKDVTVAGNILREMHGVISGNPEYRNGSLIEVTKKHEQTIKNSASQYGIDPNLALGVVFVENGGGERIRNSNSGATGVAQLMEVTAKRYGLKVGGGVDERTDPQKSIDVMCRYLADLKREFMDDGLAVWGYHAGEGNVYDALRAYFKGVDGRDYGDAITDATSGETYRKLISERKLGLHKVLQNPTVQKEVLSGLTDETELYGYKVLAGYQLYNMNTKPSAA